MSSPLTAAEVERIAALAHLALTDEERVRFTKQLADILTYVAEIGQVAIDGVPPTSHALLPQAALRADAPEPSLARDEVMAAAPGAARSAGLFRVPRVIGG
jgi:aspartyl-tRNA(Asn)/glutamyl-tRNA(Gln) amidotransferase subunit C